jgi:branched-chain amino acid transport system substrate-binding protein
VRSMAKIGVPVVAVALVLSACGSRSNGNSSSSSSGGSKTATIGIIAPLTGSLSALGLGIQHSVELAVKQANANKTVPGWTLKTDAEDDQAQPNVGQQAATKLSSDPTVVGVVGTLNSSVAQTVIPVLDKANIVQVSPANTNPALTQGANFATAPARANKNYFRVCTTDSIQGPFAAQYVYQTLGIKKAATINDQKTYGAGLVAAFEKEFKKEGGTITSHQTINDTDTDYSGVISKVKATGPGLVYYGGEFPQGGPLSKQSKAAGLNVPEMGGDGMFDPGYIKLAGAKSNGDLATSVGAPIEQLASAKQYVTDYQAAAFKDPSGAYGAYAYDAANAIINALKTSLNGKTKIDASVLQATETALQNVSFQGATGQVSFDQFGDATAKVLTVYKVTSGAWAPEKTGSFSG